MEREMSKKINLFTKKEWRHPTTLPKSGVDVELRDGKIIFREFQDDQPCNISITDAEFDAIRRWKNDKRRHELMPLPNPEYQFKDGPMAGKTTTEFRGLKTGSIVKVFNAKTGKDETYQYKRGKLIHQP
jgi:hypothetical protein